MSIKQHSARLTVLFCVLLTVTNICNAGLFSKSPIELENERLKTENEQLRAQLTDKDVQIDKSVTEAKYLWIITVIALTTHLVSFIFGIRQGTKVKRLVRNKYMEDKK